MSFGQCVFLGTESVNLGSVFVVALMLVFHNNLTLCTFLKLYIYVHINCAMPTSQLQHLGEGEAVMMVCSLSSFPRPQPQCSPYKTSPRVCAYEEHCAACVVQCRCTRERLCVCNGGGGEPPRPLLHLSPKLHLPPLHHQVVGVGADVPCAGFFAGSNQGKARAQKEIVVSAKFFAKSRPGFCCVIQCGTVLF